MICPFLGLTGDADTSLAFPSNWNYCHHCKPVASVALGHQKNFCLAGSYDSCPVFLQSPNGALPRGLRNVKSARTVKKKAIGRVVFVIPALLAVMFIFGWYSLARGAAFSNLVFPETSSPATPSPSVSPTLLPTASPVTFTPFALLIPNSTLSNAHGPGVTPTTTRKPYGIGDWIGVNYIFRIYRVEQGLNLESLASVYDTTVAAVLAVNYKLSTPLSPGQLIVIPINQMDVSGLPQFEVYRVAEDTTIEKLAAQLHVDPDQLRYFNGFGTSEQQLIAKEWIIVPREKTGTQ